MIVNVLSSSYQIPGLSNVDNLTGEPKGYLLKEAFKEGRMDQKVEPEEKDSMKESVEAALSHMKLRGFKIFRMGQLTADTWEFRATLCEKGKTKARAKIFCKCVAPGKLQVEVFLSEDRKKTRHFHVFMKNDCDCQEFQVLEQGSKRTILSLSGTTSTIY